MALFPDYATLEEAKRYLRIPTDAEGGDEADDAELMLAVSAASRGIDKACNRQFGLAGSATARVFTPEYDRSRGKYVVDIFDLMTITGLVVKADLDGDGTFETTITDYRLTPVNAAPDGKPWTEIIFGPTATVSTREFSLQVTANWGWSAVPSTIKNACLLQASRIFKRRDAPFGVTGSPDMGNQLRLLAKLDPDVEVMVGTFRRWWSAA